MHLVAIDSRGIVTPIEYFSKDALKFEIAKRRSLMAPLSDAISALTQERAKILRKLEHDLEGTLVATVDEMVNRLEAIELELIPLVDKRRDLYYIRTEEYTLKLDSFVPPVIMLLSEWFDSYKVSGVNHVPSPFK